MSLRNSKIKKIQKGYIHNTKYKMMYTENINKPNLITLVAKIRDNVYTHIGLYSSRCFI